MFLFPIGTFYFSFYVIFEGNQDMLGWSGLLAVMAANIVVVAYVIMAWNEDANEVKAEEQKKLSLKTD